MDTTSRTRRLKRQLGDWMRARLPFWITEFVMFVLKQGWAAIFGGLQLLGILTSHKIWQSDWPLARYDALLLYALSLQVLLVATGMESWREVRVIMLFHRTSTRIWLYSGQHPSDWVSLAKMGSWYLLLYVRFVTVTLVFRDALIAPAAAKRL